MWLSGLPQKMDAQLDVAFVPPHANMSCVVWVWDDVCLSMARHCRAVHSKPTVCNDRHAKQKREHSGHIQFAPHFQFRALVDVCLGLISNIHFCTPNIHFPGFSRECAS